MKIENLKHNLSILFRRIVLQQHLLLNKI